jgi:hypothetical protein
MNNKNLGQGTEWSLYSLKPLKEYPTTIYVWINPEGVIDSMRSIEPFGYSPLFTFDEFIGEDKSILKGMGFKKVINHKMNDEQMAKGWLC